MQILGKTLDHTVVDKIVNSKGIYLGVVVFLIYLNASSLLLFKT